MVAISKIFGTCGDFPSKRVNEVSISNFKNKVNDLTSLVRSLACENLHRVKVCSICSFQRHASNMCSTIQEDYIKQANIIDGAFNEHLQCKYDPFPTCTILDGEIIHNYTVETSLNKAIKADNSMDFSPNRIIKRDSPLHSQIPMLWGHQVMIFMR